MPKPISETSRLVADAEASEKEESSGANESTPRRSHRRFTATQKLRFVQAADAAIASGKRGALQALLRREGLYSSHITSWRCQMTESGTNGLIEKKRGRKPALKSRELLALEKRNAVLERKLQVANALIELQKKAHAILELSLPETDEDY